MPVSALTRSLAARSSGSLMKPTATSTRGSSTFCATSHASTVLSLVPALNTMDHGNRSRNRSTSSRCCSGKNRSRSVILDIAATPASDRQLLADVAERLRDQFLGLGVEHAPTDGANRAACDRLARPFQQRRAVAGVDEVGAGGHVNGAAETAARNLHVEPAS